MEQQVLTAPDVRSPWALSRSAFFGIAASTALLVVLAVGVGAACGSYLARAAFASTAAVRSAELFPDETATVRAQPIWASTDGRTVHALLAEPVAPDAEPPFGLRTWPQPGEFLVSADLLGDRDALGARFGRFAGTLLDEALPSAHARVVLARPVVPLADQWRASGFGVVGPDQKTAINATGFFLDDRIGFPVAVAGIALVGVLPASVLLLTCLGLVRRTHDRLARTLEALGVSPRRLHRFAFRAVLPAVATGLAATGCLVAIAAVVDIPVPLAEFTVRAIDVRREAWVYVAAWCAGSLLAVAVALLATRPAPLVPHNRLRARTRSPLRPYVAIIGVASVIVLSQVAVSEAAAAMASGQDRGTILWLIGGSFIALALMPAMTAEVLGGLAAALARKGRAAGRATPLLVGRGLRESPGAVRIASTGSALIVIAGLSSTWALMGSIPAVQAREVLDRVDGEFVTFSPPGDAAPSPEQIGLPAGTSALTLVEEWREIGGGMMEAHATIYGTGEDLAHWGLTDGAALTPEGLPGVLSAAVSTGDGTRVRVRDARPVLPADGGAWPVYIAFDDDGSSVDREAIQRALSSIGGPSWSASLGGEAWLIGAADLAHDLRWIGWFGVVGGCLLIAALWMRTVDDQRAQILTGAAVDALFSQRALLPRLLALRIGVVAAVTAAIGGGTALMYARVTNGDLTTTGGSTPVVVAICAAFALTLALVAAPQIYELRAVGRDWRPGGTDA